jgi:hypothetical protein
VFGLAKSWLWPELANALGFVVAFGVSFGATAGSLSRRRHRRGRARRFAVTAVAGFAVNEAVFSLLLRGAGWPSWLALFAAMGVAAGQTFVLGRFCLPLKRRSGTAPRPGLRTPAASRPAAGAGRAAGRAGQQPGGLPRGLRQHLGLQQDPPGGGRLEVARLEQLARPGVAGLGARARPVLHQAQGLLGLGGEGQVHRVAAQRIDGVAGRGAAGQLGGHVAAELAASMRGAASVMATGSAAASSQAAANQRPARGRAASARCQPSAASSASGGSTGRM